MGNETSSTETTSSSSDRENNKASEIQQSKVENENVKTEGKEEKKRPCCVCKETRAQRDLCYAEKSPNGFEECYKEIQAHKDCMLKEGFKI